GAEGGAKTSPGSCGLGPGKSGPAGDLHTTGREEPHLGAQVVENTAPDLQTTLHSDQLNREGVYRYKASENLSPRMLSPSSSSPFNSRASPSSRINNNIPTSPSTRNYGGPNKPAAAQHGNMTTTAMTNYGYGKMNASTSAQLLSPPKSPFTASSGAAAAGSNVYPFITTTQSVHFPPGLSKSESGNNIMGEAGHQLLRKNPMHQHEDSPRVGEVENSFEKTRASEMNSFVSPRTKVFVEHQKRIFGKTLCKTKVFLEHEEKFYAEQVGVLEKDHDIQDAAEDKDEAAGYSSDPMGTSTGPRSPPPSNAKNNTKLQSVSDQPKDIPMWLSMRACAAETRTATHLLQLKNRNDSVPSSPAKKVVDVDHEQQISSALSADQQLQERREQGVAASLSSPSKQENQFSPSMLTRAVQGPTVGVDGAPAALSSAAGSSMDEKDAAGRAARPAAPAIVDNLDRQAQETTSSNLQDESYADKNMQAVVKELQKLRHSLDLERTGNALWLEERQRLLAEKAVLEEKLQERMVVEGHYDREVKQGKPRSLSLSSPRSPSLPPSKQAAVAAEINDAGAVNKMVLLHDRQSEDSYEAALKEKETKVNTLIAANEELELKLERWQKDEESYVAKITKLQDEVASLKEQLSTSRTSTQGFLSGATSGTSPGLFPVAASSPAGGQHVQQPELQVRNNRTSPSVEEQILVGTNYFAEPTFPSKDQEAEKQEMTMMSSLSRQGSKQMNASRSNSSSGSFGEHLFSTAPAQKSSSLAEGGKQNSLRELEVDSLDNLKNKPFEKNATAAGASRSSSPTTGAAGGRLLSSGNHTPTGRGSTPSGREQQASFSVGGFYEDAEHEQQAHRAASSSTSMNMNTEENFLALHRELEQANSANQDLIMLLSRAEKKDLVRQKTIAKLTEVKNQFAYQLELHRQRHTTSGAAATSSSAGSAVAHQISGTSSAGDNYSVTQSNLPTPVWMMNSANKHKVLPWAAAEFLHTDAGSQTTPMLDHTTSVVGSVGVGGRQHDQNVDTTATQITASGMNNYKQKQDQGEGTTSSAADMLVDREIDEKIKFAAEQVVTSHLGDGDGVLEDDDRPLINPWEEMTQQLLNRENKNEKKGPLAVLADTVEKLRDENQILKAKLERILARSRGQEQKGKRAIVAGQDERDVSSTAQLGARELQVGPTVAQHKMTTTSPTSVAESSCQERKQVQDRDFKDQKLLNDTSVISEQSWITRSSQQNNIVLSPLKSQISLNNSDVSSGREQSVPEPLNVEQELLDHKRVSFKSPSGLVTYQSPEDHLHRQDLLTGLNTRLQFSPSEFQRDHKDLAFTSTSSTSIGASAPSGAYAYGDLMMTQRPAEAGSLQQQQQQQERLEQVIFGNTEINTGVFLNSSSIPPAAATTSDAGSEKKLKKLVEQQSLQIQQLNEIREQEVEAKSQELQVALEELQVRNEEIEKLEAALVAASEELEAVKKELEERRQLPVTQHHQLSPKSTSPPNKPDQLLSSITSQPRAAATTAREEQIAQDLQIQAKAEILAQERAEVLATEKAELLAAARVEEIENEYLQAMEETREQIWEEVQQETFTFLAAHNVGEEVLELVQLMGRASSAMRDLDKSFTIVNDGALLVHDEHGERVDLEGERPSADAAGRRYSKNSEDKNDLREEEANEFEKLEKRLEEIRQKITESTNEYLGGENVFAKNETDTSTSSTTQTRRTSAAPQDEHKNLLRGPQNKSSGGSISPSSGQVRPGAATISAGGPRMPPQQTGFHSFYPEPSVFSSSSGGPGAGIARQQGEHGQIRFGEDEHRGASAHPAFPANYGNTNSASGSSPSFLDVVKTSTAAQEEGGAGSTTRQLVPKSHGHGVGQSYAAPATSPEQHYQRQTDTTGIPPHQTAFQPDRAKNPFPSCPSPGMVGATNGARATSSSSPPSQYPPQSSSDLTSSSSSSSSSAPQEPPPPPEVVPPAPSTSFRPPSRTTSRFAHVPEVEIESRSQSALEGAVAVGGSATYADVLRDENINNTFERLRQPVSTTSRGEQVLPTPGAQQQVGDPGAPFAARSGGQQQTNFYGGGSVYNISQSATATPAGAPGASSRFDFAQMMTTGRGGIPGGFANGRAATSGAAAPAAAASTSFKNIDPVQYPATQIKPTGGTENRNNVVSYPLHQHRGTTPTTGSSRQTPSGTSTGGRTLLHHQQQLNQVLGVGTGTTNANNMELHLRQGGNNASGSSFVPHCNNYPQDHLPPGGVGVATAAAPAPLQVVVQQQLQQPQPQMIQANFGQQPHLQANLGAFYAQHQMQINIPTSTPGSTPQLVPTPSATPNSTSSARARPGILRNTSSTPPLNVVNHYNQQQHGGSGVGGANIAESSSRVGGNAAPLYNTNAGTAGGRSSGYGAAPGSMTGSASHQPSSASTPTNNFHQMQKRFPDSLKAKALGMNQQHAGINMAGINVTTNNNTGMMSTSGG
ncbi:unnamed protein product, partial [Amoebophrya sp. A120]